MDDANRKKRGWVHFITSDVRVIYWSLILVVSIPLIIPLGLPLPISPGVRKAFNYVESLPEGSYILFQPSTPAVFAEIGPAHYAIMQQVLDLNYKIVMYAGSAESFMGLGMVLNQVDFTGKTYGVDYVNLGYIAGAEVAVAALATDFRATVVSDYEGTPIDDLPILDGINGAEDFDLILNFDAGYSYINWIGHWTKPYQVPQICIPIGISEATAMPYYHAGDILGIIPSQKGGAEYELLLGRPGQAIRKLDALSVALLYVVVLVVLGNIQMLKEKGGL